MSLHISSEKKIIIKTAAKRAALFDSSMDQIAPDPTGGAYSETGLAGFKRPGRRKKTARMVTDDRPFLTADVTLHGQHGSTSPFGVEHVRLVLVAEPVR